MIKKCQTKADFEKSKLLIAKKKNFKIFLQINPNQNDSYDQKEKRNILFATSLNFFCNLLRVLCLLQLNQKQRF